MDDYRQMWQEIGIDLEAHDGLLEVLPPLYGDVIVNQENRPARMAYFDSFFAEIHGRRIAELVAQQKLGRKVVGTFCTYVPEEILIALGASCVGLCGGAEVAPEAVEQFLPRNLCALIKSSLGFKLGKVCPYLETSDIVIGETTCDGKKKYYEILGEFADVYVMELPQKKEEADRSFWRDEVRRFVARVEELTGVSLSLERLREATAIVNEKRGALLRLAEIRKASPPVISGKDALLINQIAFLDEPRRFARKVNEICDELEKRAAAGKGTAEAGTPRILVSGCPMAIPNWKLPHIVESSGAVIVMEELCTGIRYYRNLVDEKADDLDALLDNIADRYLDIDCAVFTPNQERVENIVGLARDYRADGVLYYALLFCAPYSVEAYKVKGAVEDAGFPFLYVETDYSQGDTQQIATRVQAFLEMITNKYCTKP
jgi:benzoyl-CoA reductase/2-hydroxyglutaryl-CoA dehydratase subunit BcrC/BadD/HgdB